MVALLVVSVSDASNASAPNPVTKLIEAVMVFWQLPEQSSSLAKMALIMSVILVYMVAATGHVDESAVTVSMST